MPLDSLNFDNVSRETLGRLEAYQALVEKWQAKLNLIGSGTQNDVWNRHIADSWQIASLIGHGETVVDMGSGAGFPALVIACRQAEMAEAGGHVTMIESNGKKCAFLREAIRAMGLPSEKVRVVNDRVEIVLATLSGVDTLTARAFTNLARLFDYSTLSAEPPKRALFPKGRGHGSEIASAQQRFDFDYTPIPSKLEQGSVILDCRNIRRKTG